jgi:hypothetical protein
MRSANRSAEFVRNLAAETEAEAAPPRPKIARRPKGQEKPSAGNSRAGLKHIGAYFDDETVEKVALLRARLKLDNSELMKLAIDELYAKQRTKRAFGDA